MGRYSDGAVLDAVAVQLHIRFYCQQEKGNRYSARGRGEKRRRVQDILFGVFADHADMLCPCNDRLLRDLSRSQQPGSLFARRVGIRIRTRIVADNACDSARNVNYRNFPARIRYR